MTDITELAQSLKNAASKALIEEGLTWFSEEQLSHEDGISLHKADAEFISLANPANVLALVEALEKAQQYAKERDAENQDLMLTVGRLRVEREELESRTVKLPKHSVGEVMHMSGFSRDYAEGWCAGNDNAIHVMRVAGIKVEGE